MVYFFIISLCTESHQGLWQLVEVNSFHFFLPSACIKSQQSLRNEHKFLHVWFTHRTSFSQNTHILYTSFKKIPPTMLHYPPCMSIFRLTECLSGKKNPYFLNALHLKCTMSRPPNIRDSERALLEGFCGALNSSLSIPLGIQRVQIQDGVLSIMLESVITFFLKMSYGE